MPPNFLLSAVVLMELAGSSRDESERKFYERMFWHYKKKELMVPNEDDWLLASKILFLLTHTRRRSQNGKLRALPPGASQRLALDVLIAVSPRRWKAQVVTENWTDFKTIQRYCNTTIVKAANFFRK